MVGIVYIQQNYDIDKAVRKTVVPDHEYIAAKKSSGRSTVYASIDRKSFITPRQNLYKPRRIRAATAQNRELASIAQGQSLVNGNFWRTTYLACYFRQTFVTSKLPVKAKGDKYAAFM
jgi:hypothetical protein